jgi:hypothetical protein
MRDLFGPPCRRPSPALAVGSTASLPYHIKAAEPDAVRLGNLPGERILHVLTQRAIRSQLACPWPPLCPIGMPLRDTCPIIEAAASHSSIALKLARDRAWRPSKLTAMALIPVPLATSIAMSSRSRNVR